MNDVLTKLFFIDPTSIKKHLRPQKITLLLRILWFQCKRLTAKDFHLIEKQIDKTVSEMKQYNNVQTLLISYLLNDDTLNKKSSFYLSIDKLTGSYAFDTAVNVIWKFMCDQLLKIRDLDNFEKMLEDVIMGWENKMFVIGWNNCHSAIINLLQMLSSLITLLFKLKSVFIGQIRKIVIQNLYPSQPIDWNLIPDHEGMSFGGAAVCHLKRYCYSSSITEETKNIYLPLTLYLTTTDLSNSEIPQRWKYENRGGFCALNHPLIPLVKQATSNIKDQMFHANKFTGHPNTIKIKTKII